jgi:hypothetical protein
MYTTFLLIDYISAVAVLLYSASFSVVAYVILHKSCSSIFAIGCPERIN